MCLNSLVPLFDDPKALEDENLCVAIVILRTLEETEGGMLSCLWQRLIHCIQMGWASTLTLSPAQFRYPALAPKRTVWEAIYLSVLLIPQTGLNLLPQEYRDHRHLLAFDGLHNLWRFVKISSQLLWHSDPSVLHFVQATSVGILMTLPMTWSSLGNCVLLYVMDVLGFCYWRKWHEDCTLYKGIRWADGIREEWCEKKPANFRPIY